MGRSPAPEADARPVPSHGASLRRRVLAWLLPLPGLYATKMFVAMSAATLDWMLWRQIRKFREKRLAKLDGKIGTPPELG